MNDVIKALLHTVNHSEGLTLTRFESRLMYALREVGMSAPQASIASSKIAFVWWMHDHDVEYTLSFGLAFLSGFVTALGLREE